MYIMGKFKYKDDTKIHIIKMNKKSEPLPIKTNNMRWREYDKGNNHRRKEFRDHAFNNKVNKFINLNFCGGGGASGFHKHYTNAYIDKLRMKPVIIKREGELKELDVIKENQRYEGGDIMGFRRLNLSEAKLDKAFLNRPRNLGDSHSKGMFGSGLRKYNRLDEINKKNNNKNTYDKKTYNEFSDLNKGIRKEKNFKGKPASDGI